MLVVETILKIRRLAHVQGKPIKAICRELGVSRKVVRKVYVTVDDTGARHSHNTYYLTGFCRLT
jgi:transposase-like protein